jgi:hypothetical protein
MFLTRTAIADRNGGCNLSGAGGFGWPLFEAATAMRASIDSLIA